MSRLLFSFMILTFIAATEAHAEDTKNLAWAVALVPHQYETLSDQELATAADHLWNWSFLGPNAPVPGTPEVRTAALDRAHAMALILLKRTPKAPSAYARIAMIDWDRGERMPKSAPKNAKLALYDEMIELSEKCIAIDPKYADCWHWLATGTGRRATTKGLLNALMSAEVVEEAWLKVLALQPATVLPNGDRTDTNARYGLTVFYRMVPESWLIKIVTGTRGDKKKAITLIRKAVATQPHRLELQKELGAALLCYGESKGDPALIAEGKKVLLSVAQGKFDKDDIRQTDGVDKQHSQEMLDKPDLACAYSRDGYQDLDESKIKK